MDLILIGGNVKQRENIISQLMSEYKSRISHLEIGATIRTRARLVKTPASNNNVRLVTGITSDGEITALRARGNTRVFHIYGTLPKMYDAITIKRSDGWICGGRRSRPAHVLSVDEAYSECLMSCEPKKSV